MVVLHDNSLTLLQYASSSSTRKNVKKDKSSLSLSLMDIQKLNSLNQKQFNKN